MILGPILPAERKLGHTRQSQWADAAPGSVRRVSQSRRPSILSQHWG